MTSRRRQMPEVASVKFLDVAQGDCIVAVDHDSGEAIVVDCPTHTADLVERALRSSGVQRIGMFILTHLHGDHIGDAIELSRRFRIRGVRTNVSANPTRTPQVLATLRAIAAMEDDDIRVGPATRGKIVLLGALRCEILAPTHGQVIGAVTRSNANHGSVVTRLAVDRRTWLLSADATGEIWEYLLRQDPNELQAHVFQLPHHGGKLDTPEDVELLDRLCAVVGPEEVVVSVGSANGHGHPRAEHLECAARHGRVMCTQVNRACLGSRPLPQDAAARLPEAVVAAGGSGGNGCSCAGTVSYSVSTSAVEVRPSVEQHATVIDLLGNPSCRIRTLASTDRTRPASPRTPRLARPGP